jgi:hypothetical protein
MTKPVPSPPAPGPLEEYAARFDDLFTRVAQRRGFREYLAGLLAPRDRNKTLTALAGAEPVTGAQHPAVQRLQFFLSGSRWDAGQVNARRLELRWTRCRAPGEALREGEERPGVPDEAGDRRGPGGPGAGGWVRVPGGMRGQRLRGSGRVPSRAGRGRAAVRDGAAAPPRDLGPRRGRAYPADAARALAWDGPDDPGDWQPAIRAVRAWLPPWIALQRWWAAWSKAPPPRQLQILTDSVAAGRGLHLYIPN